MNRCPLLQGMLPWSQACADEATPPPPATVLMSSITPLWMRPQPIRLQQEGDVGWVGQTQHHTASRHADTGREGGAPHWSRHKACSHPHVVSQTVLT